MKFKLPDNISSPQDLALLIIDLHNYSHWFNQSSILNRTHAGKQLEQPLLQPATEAFINILKDNNRHDQAGLDELIQSLENIKESSPTVTVTLAAPPTNELRKTLINWFRTNLTPSILINFNFNSTILGGMVVRCGSHIYDWSFKRQILENRQKFSEVLRNV